METAVIVRGEGNLLEAQVDALVNTVNTVGVMGKGIALQFKRAYPDMFQGYARAAKAGELAVGKMHVWATDAAHGPRYVINFPTKQHWKGRSKLEYIEAGLLDLQRVVRELEIDSVALPPLGCGNGGLRWEVVRPLIVAAFAESSVAVTLFEPSGAPEAAQMPDRRTKSRMTPGRAILLRSMQRYVDSALEAPSHLELQKLLYFVQEEGEPLKLRFAKGRYGPYADNLRHVLVELEGHYVDGYGNGTDAVTEFRPIRLRSDGHAPEPAPESAERLERTMGLCSGFATPFGMELLASTHWVATREGARGLEDCTTALWRWNPRKRELFTAQHIETAWTALQNQGWLDEPSGRGARKDAVVDGKCHRGVMKPASRSGA